MLLFSAGTGKTMVVDCVFAYGTMRAEIDRWNMIDSNCQHLKAKACGFKLYQEYSFFYPFATKTCKDSDVIEGSVLHWNDPVVFAHKLAGYDTIEGYSEDRENGLYQRIVVDVEDENRQIRKAYMYIQDQSPEYIEECFAFANGDWLDSTAREHFDTEKKRIDQAARKILGRHGP
eukprot:4608664-Ditylum_brightwellii.AAC.1